MCKIYSGADLARNTLAASAKVFYLACSYALAQKTFAGAFAYSCVYIRFGVNTSAENASAKQPIVYCIYFTIRCFPEAITQ
jgi:hypothetical protein